MILDVYACTHLGVNFERCRECNLIRKIEAAAAEAFKDPDLRKQLDDLAKVTGVRGDEAHRDRHSSHNHLSITMENELYDRGALTRGEMMRRLKYQ